MRAAFLESVMGKLAYRDSGGEGSAVVMLHGNSLSARCFARQMSAPLGESRRLIALDLPGHGDSQDAADPQSYTLPGYAEALTTFVNAVGLERAVFVGWSLGGHVLLEAAPNLPRAAGFVIFGTPPLAFPPAMDQAFLPNPALAAGFSAEITLEQAEAYVAALFKPGSVEAQASFVQDMMRADKRARAGLAASIAPNGYRDEVAVVANLRRPLAIVHGAEDQLVNGAYFDGLSAPTLWRAGVQMIRDAGHALHWEQPAIFNNLLEAFLDDFS
jgi:pimeloyl-ACP methyl ester carboxylesterase